MIVTTCAKILINTTLPTEPFTIYIKSKYIHLTPHKIIREVSFKDSSWLDQVLVQTFVGQIRHYRCDNLYYYRHRYLSLGSFVGAYGFHIVMIEIRCVPYEAVH